MLSKLHRNWSVKVLKRDSDEAGWVSLLGCIDLKGCEVNNVEQVDVGRYQNKSAMASERVQSR